MTMIPQSRGFSVFLQFSAETRISRMNDAEITKDRLGRPAYEIFSIG